MALNDRLNARLEVANRGQPPSDEERARWIDTALVAAAVVTAEDTGGWEVVNARREREELVPQNKTHSPSRREGAREIFPFARERERQGRSRVSGSLARRRRSRAPRSGASRARRASAPRWRASAPKWRARRWTSGAASNATLRIPLNFERG